MIPVAVQTAEVFCRVVVLPSPVDGLDAPLPVPRIQAGEGEAEARLVLVLSVARRIRDCRLACRKYFAAPCCN